MNEVTSPYVGLRPFGEKERAFFFGRERDTRVITANLIEEPLTIVYGPSGAGKSSVLQAGVMPQLKSLPNTAVIYFRNWQGDRFQEEFKACITSELADENGNQSSITSSSVQDVILKSKKQIFLLLDQFEEYLLYHSGEEGSNSFDGTLARIVNRDDIQTKVLIGLREDGLSKLNERFAIRIPDLLGNTLQVERLNLAAARKAIEKPLEVFSQTPAAQGLKFEIEEKLVQEILEQVQEGRAIAGDSVGKGTRSGEIRAQIETAYLQLVLTKLWSAEREQGSRLLRLETFQRLGGASKIVRDHVNSVMNGLENDQQRDIAARLFLYLVTPSGSKIAQRTEDLVAFGEAPKEEVEKVLNKLAEQQETRILRRLSNPEQYEIFHDVLARHILDWRRSYEERKRLAEQERRQKEEADRKQYELEQAQALAREQKLRADEQIRASQNLRKMVGVLIILVMLATAAAIYGWVEQRKAKNSAIQADANAIRADANARAAAALADQVQAGAEHEKAVQRELQAAQAESSGNKTEAARLRAEAAAIQNKAVEADKRAQMQGSTANTLAQQLKQTTDERDSLKGQLQSKDSELQSVKAENERLRSGANDSNAKPLSSAHPSKISAQSPDVQTAQQGSTFDSKDVSFKWTTAPEEKLAFGLATFSCIDVQISNRSNFGVNLVQVTLDTARGAQKLLRDKRHDGNATLVQPMGSLSARFCIGNTVLKSLNLEPKDVMQTGRFKTELSGPKGKFTLEVNSPPAN